MLVLASTLLLFHSTWLYSSVPGPSRPTVNSQTAQRRELTRGTHKSVYQSIHQVIILLLLRTITSPIYSQFCSVSRNWPRSPATRLAFRLFREVLVLKCLVRTRANRKLLGTDSPNGRQTPEPWWMKTARTCLPRSLLGVQKGKNKKKKTYIEHVYLVNGNSCLSFASIWQTAIWSTTTFFLYWLIIAKHYTLSCDQQAFRGDLQSVQVNKKQTKLIGSR